MVVRFFSSFFPSTMDSGSAISLTSPHKQPQLVCPNRIAPAKVHPGLAS